MSTRIPPAASPRRFAPARLSAPRPPAVPPPLRPTEVAKAVLEYPVALALAVAALPVILAAMALTRLTSRGPGLYRQARVGRGGKVFTILKIRTMAHDCESLTGPRWSVPGDPRITPLGGVLRKLHIDELPQLWNVLCGHMSLVGPRPERPEIVAQLVESVPAYATRLVVRPGITGFAQVHLPPDTNLQSVRNKVAYDRFYIARMGLRLDATVYACTLLKVLGLSAFTGARAGADGVGGGCLALSVLLRVRGPLAPRAEERRPRRSPAVAGRHRVTVPLAG